MRRALVLAVAFSLLLAVPGCKRRRDDGTSPDSRSLPALDLRDDSHDLLLTWVDAKGDFHTAQSVPDVPSEGREAVRVIVTNRDEGATTDLVYVANLTDKRPDGTYQVGTMTRAEWDAIAEKRRAPKIVEAAPHVGRDLAPPTPRDDTPPPMPGQPGKVTVIIYGAAWCGPCHEAQAHLRRRGVPVVFHDIEQDQGAAAEMQKKLNRAGKRGGSIPIIDVGGRLLVGYSEQALDAALVAAGNDGTAL